jgi:ABC-type multidrug transport system fused ATPase/permease subunit
MFFYDYLKKILYLIGDDKKKLPWMIFLFIILSFFELLGLGLIVPYMSLIINPENSQVASFFYPIHKSIDIQNLLIIFSLTLISIFSMKSFFLIIINRKIFSFANLTGANLRQKLLSYYQEMNYEDYINRNSSQYLYSIQDLAITFSQNTMIAVLKIFSEGALAICILIFLALTDLIILLSITALIGTFLYLYDLVVGDKITSYGSATNKYQTKTIKTVNEAINGFKEIKVYNKEKYFYDKVSDMSFNYANTYTKLLVLKTIPRYVLELILVISVITVILISIFIDRDLSTTIPVLSVFCVSGLRLMPAASAIYNGIAQLRFGYNSTTILFNDLFAKKIIQKKGPENEIRIFENLDLKNISFSYNKKAIFKSTSLSITAGEAIGIIGETGSGKTTLINIILGLISPKSGTISLNGKKINNKTNGLKGLVAYIPQNTFIVDDSIKKNIALGIENDEIDIEKVINAAELSQLSDFIESLPNGLDTNVGENGARLSGGQRQRLTLARAFYFDRQLFIMDEATSALDSQTELEITNAMKSLKGKFTTIVVAHRYSTLKECDRIYEIKNGNLIYRGNYNDIS